MTLQDALSIDPNQRQLEAELHARLARREALPGAIEASFELLARLERRAAFYAEWAEAQKRYHGFCPCRRRNRWRCDRCRNAANEIKRCTRRMVKAKDELRQQSERFEALLAEADRLKVRV